MTIVYTGRKAGLTPALKAVAEARLEKLEKVLGDILDARVILTREKHRQVAEIIVKAKNRTLTAKGEAPEFAEAIGAAGDRLLAQARRHADRRVNRRRGRGPWKVPRKAAAAVPIETVVALPEVVRLGSFRVRVMSVRQALVVARDEEPEVIVFRDLASERVAFLFRRPDGQYGLVETEA
ncbi:MAG TPA: ribosome-associated translation inhibitor RaiA [Candidatus Polarisedimenticolia bacterium]|nr:ribosome-associated translation inhibitor RaiA [Candidatus Polarisedimenticolia bacterium]